MKNMTTEEIIQYDLDAGRYGGICSNEDTFKAYVFRKIEEARNEGRSEVFRKIEEQKEKIIKEMDRLKPLWITNLTYLVDNSCQDPFVVAETHLDIILNDIKEILNK